MYPTPLPASALPSVLTPEPPLCVDLDGTLIRSDLLYESVFLLLRDKPWLVFALPFWLFQGRAVLKHKILQHVHVPVETLPYNQPLLEWLRAEKAQGRTLVLATAADRAAAEPLADHLRLFDLVLSSDGVRNLKGSGKLEKLQSRYGSNFDYVGNSNADLPIWKGCRHAIVVDATPTVEKKARQAANVSRVFNARQPLVPLLLREMRPHQWIKNLLIFVPLITSHRAFQHGLFLEALVAFIGFSLVASSVYVLNDLFDLQSDRLHARKRLRPLASGDLSLPWAVPLGPGLLLAGFSLVAWLTPGAVGILAFYFLLTVFYSYWLKRKLLLDVFALAALYTLRMLMGSAAYHIELSVWLLSFSMFLFLSLGFAKRSAELSNMIRAAAPLNSRRAYAPSDLPQVNLFGVAAGFASSLVLTLYMNSDNVRVLYHNPNLLWLLFPLMLYWVSRIWIITSRGKMDEDPVLFAMKDKVTILVLLFAGVIMFLATREWFRPF